MTSKSLFLVRSIENHKRRIWVWIISMLAQLALFPGIMTVYLIRIRIFQANGSYNNSAGAFRHALCDAAADALGFKTQAPVVIGLLAALIGVQGFSYLYSRKKVDMYHSVPVHAKDRFFVVYINGIIIYLASYLFSLMLALGIAGINGALDGRALIECSLAFALNLLYFLVIYNAVTLAVMLTGNIIITGGVAIALLYIDLALEAILDDMRLHFFSTADSMFYDADAIFNVLFGYIYKVEAWKREENLSQIIDGLLPFYLKCAVLVIVFGALAYLCHKLRPSEATGRAIAFPKIKPVLKIIISVTGGIAACDFLYIVVFRYAGDASLSAGNAALLCGGMGLAALLCCGVMEAVYEFDVRAAVKHIASTSVAVVITVAVFCIYYFDVFGYDSYMPEPGKVESMAVHFFYDQEYFKVDGKTGSSRQIGEISWLKDNMFLTDVDAVCRLIENSRENDGNPADASDSDIRSVNVLFRLKSGREVSRRYEIDFADASNEEPLNRIIGTKEFKEGYYQICRAEDMVRSNNWKILYSNGTMEAELRVDAARLREAWLKDMEQFDFTLARNNRQCGYLDFSIPDMYRSWRLPVYESFENTVAFLEEEGVYVPAKVRAEDVASITVVNWNYDMQNGAAWDSYASGPSSEAAYSSRPEYQKRETYDNPDEIAEIIAAIHPADLCYSWKWNEHKGYDENYEVMISFKTDTEYPYIPMYYYYEFISGQVPDFVKEATAYTPAE